MPLSDAERDRVRYHCGYMSVQPAASIQYGVPRPIPTMFLIEAAMSNLLEVAVDRVRRVLQILDNIENKLVDSQDRLAADQLGDLKIRATEPDQLEGEYRRWAFRLADILGVPLYYYSRKLQGGGVKAGSIPVR